MRRPLANALDIDLAGGLMDQATPHAGPALLIEVLRRSGVIAAAERHLPAKKSTKGLPQGELVEAFMVLSALGGECLDDFDTCGGIAVWPGGWGTTCRRRRPRGNDWTSSTILRWWPNGRSRAASSRPRAPGWPGCGRWSSTACGPSAWPSSRGRP